MVVLLVHGLGRTPLSLFGLASALRPAGHRTRFFAYSPTFESMESIVRRLESRLRSLARSGRPVGLVGHSLGGLLLRLALERVPELQVHHFIMLGTPNRGSLLARRASRWLLFRLFTGECGRFLAGMDGFAQLRPLRVPFTVIGGTGGPLGRHWSFENEPNDGIVSVAEAAIESAAVATFPVFHTYMMDAAAVRAKIISLLRTEYSAKFS